MKLFRLTLPLIIIGLSLLAVTIVLADTAPNPTVSSVQPPVAAGAELLTLEGQALITATTQPQAVIVVSDTEGGALHLQSGNTLTMTLAPGERDSKQFKYCNSKSNPDNTTVALIWSIAESFPVSGAEWLESISPSGGTIPAPPPGQLQNCQTLTAVFDATDLPIDVISTTLTFKNATPTKQLPDVILTVELTVEPFPVVLVPAFAGSILKDSSGNELWPGAPVDDSLLDISLYPSHNPKPIHAPDVIRREFLLGIEVADIYGTFLEYLPQQKDPITQEFLFREYDIKGRTKENCDYEGQRENKPNLFVFPYDWRLDISENARLLGDYIQGCIKRFHPNRKVNIVAHSMGGLVSRRYIISNPKNNVNALITVGTSWLGAPKTIYVLHTGRSGLDFFIASPPRLKQVIGSFTGGNQLLPSRAYYELGGGPVIEEEGWDINNNGNEDDKYIYEEYLNLMNSNSRYAREGFRPGQDTQNFHDKVLLQDNWSTDTTGVDYYHFIGMQNSPRTIRSLIAKQLLFVTDNPPMTSTFDLMIPKWTFGDGTVPLISAERIRANLNYNAPQARYAKLTGDDATLDHVELMKNPSVLLDVKKVLLGQEPTLLKPVADSAATTVEQQNISKVQEANYLMILGGTTSVVADQLGNTTAPISGTILGEVPNVDTYILGDNAEMIILPTSGVYTITFETLDRPLFIELRTGTGDTTSRATRYLDVSLPANVTVQLRLTPQGITASFDQDGNGSFETAIDPTVNVSGPDAQDVDPPKIGISKTLKPNGLVQVILTAEDTQSGVAVLQYSLDGSQFQPYKSTLTLDPKTTPVIYAFADDNLANRSGLYSYELLDELYLPLIVKGQ